MKAPLANANGLAGWDGRFESSESLESPTVRRPEKVAVVDHLFVTPKITIPAGDTLLSAGYS